MDDLDLLAQGRPEVAPPDPAARARARRTLQAGIDAAEAPRAWTRPRRLVAAGLGVTLPVLVALVLGLGPVPDVGPGEEAPDGGLLGPAPAAALVETSRGPGYTDVRFLEPTADPARIRAALDDLGIDLEVSFVPADPFTVGRLVMSSGAEGIEVLGATGSELEGGPVGIRVPDGWSGSGEIAIARAAEPGETFETSIPLNAERPDGPLHCTDLRGKSPAEAARTVQDLGYTVEWRTLTDGHSAVEEPPAHYVVHDVLWHRPRTIMIFAAAPPAEPLSGEAAALVSRGCGEDA